MAALVIENTVRAKLIRKGLHRTHAQRLAIRQHAYVRSLAYTRANYLSRLPVTQPSNPLLKLLDRVRRDEEIA
jgi:hypothetical protein